MKNLVFFCSLLLFVACGTQTTTTQQSNSQSPEIENTHWTLVEFDGKPVPESIVGKVYIELNSKENRFSGSNGCNRIMGEYKITNGTQVSFSKVASTRMACSNKDWNEFEFNKVLETANNFTISGNKLMLNVGKRMPLAVFVKTTKESIVNKYWKLIKLNGKAVKMADNQVREQYFILREDGTVSGFAGCNHFSGKFDLEADKLRIRFKKMSSTLRACPNVKVDESKFLKVFELTDNYSLHGDTLSLNVGRRAPLAVFKAVYF